MRLYSQLHLRALCMGKEEDIFPVNGRPRTKAIKENLCPLCPVREECLNFALNSEWEPHGMWAGYDQSELKAMWVMNHPGAKVRL